MSIIDRLAAEIESEPASELEELCRHAVAAEMRHAKRLLTADEIEDITEDTFEDEAVSDLDVDEDGEVEVTEHERANIPEESIVMMDEDGEVVEGVVVEGKFARLRVIPDHRCKHVAKRIATHMESLALMANINEGINLKSLYHPVPNVTMPCPKCSSRNVTPVWFDSGQVIACCNECATEFEASVDDVAHATLAERTVEDIDILPEYDVFGSVWLKDGGYGYEVYASGELIDSGEAETFDEVQERFDDIADAYDEIEEDAEIDFASGESDTVEDIDGDELILESGRKASRARVARMVADKKAFVAKNDLGGIKITAGRGFHSPRGSVIVESIMPNGVYARVVTATADGRIAERMVRFTERELKAYLKRHNLA